MKTELKLTPGSLREAVIVKELLDRPLALRRDPPIGMRRSPVPENGKNENQKKE